MTRQTIDYGIDLGTTNSSVAVLVGTTAEVVPNRYGSSFTPSAVWFDKRGKLYVGQEAKARYIDDEENTGVEFKLRMGEPWKKTFQRSGVALLPEEMSAEVLKSLRIDVQTNKGEDLRAAVVTVPAAFELPQCEATRRAAELAGLTLSPLLQEPVAAALAHGFQAASNKVFWLVYDFGGGTFDAAVIQVRDGVIQVVNHAGDNYLGGKNIDWDIVEKLLMPKLASERPLAGFSRQNPKWRSALAKLKSKAEEAKIQVSRTQRPTEIWIEDLCRDDRGETIDFTFELQPAELQRITAPWVAQSISLCKLALRDKGLSGRDIEKVIMVGGSSLFPWLQEELTRKLGARLDLSIDPMTVVARGAAVFAGTQRLEAPDRTAARPGTFVIQLEYEPVGSETDPMVGGRIQLPPGASPGGLSIEIVESRSQWRSGAIRVAANGTFMTEVHAERGRRCDFQIVLTDSRGTRLPCSPEEFSYTVGMVITSPPLTHNLGVAMANNKPLWFFRKGEPLPARATHVLHTTVALRKGAPKSEDNVIQVPVVEGTNDGKADRNSLVGHLEILPTDPRVKRDIPLGSEIEVSIQIDASRTTTTTAFIPILDEEFKRVFDPRIVAKSPDRLQSELEAEAERLRVLAERAEEVSEPSAQAAISRLRQEQVLETVHRHVAAAQGDSDALGEADRRLLDLKAAVDGVEDVLEWPGLVAAAREQVSATREIVDAHGQADDKAQMRALEGDIEPAIAEERAELLRTRIDELRSLATRVLVQQPGFWLGYLEYLDDLRGHMRDQGAAGRLFAQAAHAVNNNDLEALKAAVRQLVGLLPADEREEAEARGGFGGTIISH